MTSAFRDISIEQLCTKVTTGATPLRSRNDYYEAGTIDWYKTGELKDWYLGPAAERITEKALEETSAKLFPADTVLMAMYGDGSTITSLGMLHAPAATNQACSAMLVDKGKCDTRYFFYALKSRRHLLLKVASGGAQRNLSGKLIKEFTLPVPPLQLQRRIANILSAYDELIENNQRRIRILEAMARTLYREWFVHFRFPGHEKLTRIASPLGDIPKGWQVKKLGDIADIRWGDTATTKASYVEEGYAAYSASGLDGKLDHYDFNRAGIVLSAIGAQCGKTWLAKGKWSCIKNTIRFWSTNECVSTEFLFIATEGQDFWPRRGAAQPFISQGDAERKELLTPDGATMERFTKFSANALEQIATLQVQIQNLRRTRDLLLPRLLSGTSGNLAASLE
jgi:type I restriction enzyme S subunit